MTKSLKLKAIDHVGIVVSDIYEKAARFSKLFGIGPWYRSSFTEQEVIYQGEKISLELDLLFAFNGKVKIELIGATSSQEHVYSKIMEKQGGGLHHQGYMVKGFEKKIKAFANAGIKLIQHGTMVSNGGAVTRYAYMDTIKECGIITEIIETKLMGISVPQNKFMMNLGRLTRDTEKLKISV